MWRMKKGAFTDELIKKIKKNDRSLRKINITGNKKKHNIQTMDSLRREWKRFGYCVFFCFVYVKTSDFS